MTTMTDTESRTEDQVQVPEICQATTRMLTARIPCTELADYEVLMSCPSSHEKRALTCSSHYAQLLGDQVVCRACTPYGSHPAIYRWLVVARKI